MPVSRLHDPIEAAPVPPPGPAGIPAVVDASANSTMTPNGDSTRRRPLLALLAVVALGAAGFVGYSLASLGDDAEPAPVSDEAPVVRGEDDARNGAVDDANADESTESAEQPPVEPVVGDATAGDTGTIDPSASTDPDGGTESTAPTEPGSDIDTIDASADTPAPVAEPTDGAEPVEEATAASTESSVPMDEQAGAGDGDEADDAPLAQVEESRGVVRNGQIFLEGAVPTAEAGEEIAALAAEILGEDNVFNNYVVDPRAGDPSLGNLTVEDTINFGTNSSVILSESEGLLNQGLALFTIRPNMTMTVVGHTDARGSEEQNQVLSEQRAESVKQWFVDRGVDGSRITAEGAGESDPIADNDTAEGQRLNRRIQFFLENLLS